MTAPAITQAVMIDGATQPGHRVGTRRMAEPRQLPQITETLLDRGWTEADIRKVQGENFRRVAGAVWK